jgi:hypothetical protein
MDRDTAMGVAAELRHFLKEGWEATYNSQRFTIEPPNSFGSDSSLESELVDEVWRIARLVAYQNFVSISQEPDGSFTVVSERQSGGGFEIRFPARVG